MPALTLLVVGESNVCSLTMLANIVFEYFSYWIIPLNGPAGVQRLGLPLGRIKKLMNPERVEAASHRSYDLATNRLPTYRISKLRDLFSYISHRYVNVLVTLSENLPDSK